MTRESALFLFAGSMILLSVALTYYVHPYWMWLTVFVGFNMVQSSFTGFCVPTIIMAKFGMKSKCDKVTE